MTEPFYMMFKELTARKDLTASDKIVFTVLKNYQANNGHCWPGIQSLTDQTGIARRTILRSIHRLESVGILGVERRGRGYSNHYTTSAKMTLLTEKNQCQNDTTGSAKKAPEVVPKRHPNKTKDLLNETTAKSEFAFVLRSRKLWYLPQAKLTEYQSTFAALDVETELRKATQWLLDNPDRRKTAKGMTRFLGGWLGRVTPKRQPQRGDPDWLPSEKELDEIYEQC